jgi:hypothetical protein
MSLVAEPLAGSAAFTRSDADSRASVATIAWAGVCMLVLVAPFEALQPVVVIAGQSLSTVEAALVAVFAAWTIALVSSRTFPAWRTTLTLPWLFFLAALLVAALAAPSHQSNALNMVGRMGLAFGVYLLGVNGILTPLRLRAVLAVTAAAGTAVAVLALLEYFAVAPVLSVLSAFRPWVALVGSQVRAGGPLQYPTIASMFLEIAFAFALASMLMGIDARRRAAAASFLIVAAVIGQAIVFTFTRAGLITVASTLVIVGWLRYRTRGVDRGLAAVAIVAALFVVELLSSRSAESLRLRLTTETMDAWYRAEIGAPADLQLATGGRSSVPVVLRNAGGTTWDSSGPQPFHLSYHWLRADDDTVVSWEGVRTPFPARVPPGSTVALDAVVEAPPEPGVYRLMWDVEQRHLLWFSTEPGAALPITRVVVAGPRVGTLPTVASTVLPSNVVRPGRWQLWRAAGELFAGRPILGIGPDNYRLRYGDAAGLSTFDRRVHANNMYLEILVGAGIVGGAAFAWLCRAIAGELAAALRASSGAGLEPAAAAIAAAVVAIALHGLVDSFLSFTATYTLFAVTLALLSALLALHRTHAHRI